MLFCRPVPGGRAFWLAAFFALVLAAPAAAWAGAFKYSGTECVDDEGNRGLNKSLVDSGRREWTGAKTKTESGRVELSAECVDLASALGKKPVEALRRLIREKRLALVDGAGVNLRGASLAKMRLGDLDLTGADLSGADLRGTNMRKIQLDGHTRIAEIVCDRGTSLPAKLDPRNANHEARCSGRKSLTDPGDALDGDLRDAGAKSADAPADADPKTADPAGTERK